MKLKICVAILACLTTAMASNALARELSVKEKNIIEQATKQQLKDPDSAKFYWQDYRGGSIYCAHVNSKNSYGGYSGKALLLIGVKNDSHGNITSASASIRSDNMMDEICIKRGYSV